MTKWTSIAGRKRNDWIDFYQTPLIIQNSPPPELFAWHIFEIPLFDVVLKLGQTHIFSILL